MYTPEQWQIAEEKVKERAIRSAYMTTDDIPNAEYQKLTYRLVRDCVMAGARIMQEEITKFDNRLMYSPPLKDSLLNGDYTSETTEDY